MGGEVLTSGQQGLVHVPSHPGIADATVLLSLPRWTTLPGTRITLWRKIKPRCKNERIVVLCTLSIKTTDFVSTFAALCWLSVVEQLTGNTRCLVSFLTFREITH